MSRRLAVDIGGTFTDLVSLDETTGVLDLGKTLTTPANFADGVLDAITQGHVDLADVSQFVHGTTVVINALTERTGCRVALVTTRGFRDVLEIQRANRTDMYNLLYRKPAPFVPRALRFEVRERVTWKGEVLSPLSEEDVLEVAAACRRNAVEAIAVCFLHAYAHVEHEARAKRLLEDACPGIPVSASHELTREWREYERTNTTVLNAYVRPVADAYLASLAEQLQARGLRGSMLTMQSNGGTSSFTRSRRLPIHLVESGPVGGIIGAAAVARQAGLESCIAFDMGGTTAKVSVIESGEIAVRTDYHLERSQTWAGYPLRIPVVDIVEVGAGGGSIAWLDEGGGLHVGPRSAGASPGPACYNRGGDLPTVTDANLVAGRLDPDYFLGGRMTLDGEKARRAVASLGERVGLGIDDAAMGILRLVNANMQAALERVTVERGHDPRDFALVAYGGAGGLHASSLARQLHVGTILIPAAPGQFSAWGMLLTDLRQDFVRTRVAPCTPATWTHVRSEIRDLTSEALRSFGEERVVVERAWAQQYVDLRYAGQEHAVLTPILEGDDLDRLLERFHALHERAYAFRLADPVEVVNYHVAAWGTVRKPSLREVDAGSASLSAARKKDRRVQYEGLGWVNARVFERDRIPVDLAIGGPAVIEEPASTTIVLPGQTVRRDRFGNLILVEEDTP
ncbi:MAG: hydantoinase/oxoprolinase family protein [Candidatus Bipolaricaulis sp.]|nr:hydantoinase/oxoprolinase family protein [Candidatus Bipolaricaulis sp.]